MKNKIIKTCIIGSTNVGKSTFFNSIIGNKISIVNKKRNTTKDSIIGILNIKNIQMIFYDTPGIEQLKEKYSNKKNNENLWNSILFSDVVLYLIDVSKKNIVINSRILNNVKDENKKIIIILNKIDLINKLKILPIIDLIIKKYKFNIIIPISAKKKISLDGVIKKLKSFSYKSDWIYLKNQITNKDNNFLSQEITRNSILRNLNDEIPYSIQVINTKWKLVKKNNLIINQDLIINKTSHKKIIIGKKGSMIKKIRETSQNELQKIFKQKVHLFIQLKISK